MSQHEASGDLLRSAQEDAVRNGHTVAVVLDGSGTTAVVGSSIMGVRVQNGHSQSLICGRQAVEDLMHACRLALIALGDKDDA